MKKFILILICCAITLSVKAQQTGYKLSKSAVSCGGFIVSASTVNDKLSVDSTIIYGKVTDCISKDEVYARIVIFNEANKRVDSLYTDKHGNYKKRIHTGTYKLWAGNPAYGSIHTEFIDFFPQKSTGVDLYISVGPTIKD